MRLKEWRQRSTGLSQTWLLCDGMEDVGNCDHFFMSRAMGLVVALFISFLLSGLLGVDLFGVVLFGRALLARLLVLPPFASVLRSSLFLGKELLQLFSLLC
jgi:hypothetical protein